MTCVDNVTFVGIDVCGYRSASVSMCVDIDLRRYRCVWISICVGIGVCRCCARTVCLRVTACETATAVQNVKRPPAGQVTVVTSVDLW